MADTTDEKETITTAPKDSAPTTTETKPTDTTSTGASTHTESSGTSSSSGGASTPTTQPSTSTSGTDAADKKKKAVGKAYYMYMNLNNMI